MKMFNSKTLGLVGTALLLSASFGVARADVVVDDQWIAKTKNGEEFKELYKLVSSEEMKKATIQRCVKALKDLPVAEPMCNCQQTRLYRDEKHLNNLVMIAYLSSKKKEGVKFEAQSLKKYLAQLDKEVDAKMKSVNTGCLTEPLTDPKFKP